MQQIRCEIDQGLEEMVASARGMVDWKHYVKTYPWLCLGTAAALGFLIVPKRSVAIHPDAATLEELARTGHLVAQPAAEATRGLVGELLATVASIAVRQGIEFVGQSAARLLGRAADLPLPSPPATEQTSDRAYRRG
jgi:hypothetical protein